MGRGAWWATVLGVINTWARDFPGGPVVKNSTSNAGDVGSNPSQGTKILHAATELMGAV